MNVQVLFVSSYFNVTSEEREDYIKFLYYSPALKKGAILDLGCPSFRPSVRSSVRHSVRHNSVSAQYLENKLTKFHQILYMHQDLAWDCYTSGLDKQKMQPKVVKIF